MIEKKFLRINVSDIVKMSPLYENISSVSCKNFQFCRITIKKSCLNKVDGEKWQVIDIVNQRHKNFDLHERKILKIIQKQFKIDFSDGSWLENCEESVDVGVEISSFADYEEASPYVKK